ncbi:MAG: protein-L-isoaspartate(D-aspartate) O-methyltransferase [Bacteroidetes bacterium]|nr:protein-L-isoaspartate(D-aspartate) O-methyltransferase [Bacteroidota bacterium]MBP6316272.1 protein-L-isoaspartate(D-aspartate) O-methyltransferase [Chitinophagaceae bacterium]
MITKKVDTYKHKGLRNKLVDTLRNKGISDEAVLSAIEAVPRHFFLDLAFDKIAYEDRAFPIGEGQTISQPYTVAYQTQLLQIEPRNKVLEIGTGSVYQASILAEMGAAVFTIERQKKLYDKNITSYPFLSKYKNIKFFYGDGYKGLPTFGPFDKILITAAAPFVPKDLIDQLKPNGILVLPLGNDDKQTMTRITKQADGSLYEEPFDDFIFVPMLKGKVEN